MTPTIRIGKGELILAAGIGAMVLYFYWDAKRGVAAVANKAGAAVGYVADKVNPASPTNAVNQVVTGVGQVVKNDPSWSPGVSLFEWLNQDVLERERVAAAGRKL